MPNGFRVQQCDHIWLHLRVQTQFLGEKCNRFCNSTTCPPGLTAQGEATNSERVLRRIYSASSDWGCSDLEPDLSQGAPDAWRPRPSHPKPARARPEAGKVARRAWSAGSKAEGVAGRPSPSEQRPQVSGPALPSSPSPCLCTSLLSSGPSAAPGPKVHKQPRLSNWPAVVRFRDPGRGPSPWRTEVVCSVLNNTSFYQ